MKLDDITREMSYLEDKIDIIIENNIKLRRYDEILRKKTKKKKSCNI